ncbi:MAG: hypothetical protein QGH59_08480, partial [Gemmatimonadota bacterium]|nr:hypothetical protein [Gemmatimonadota bacterium]
PTGVELIPGHTYVVWTWDSHFAKFRVTEEYFTTPGIPAGVQIDWAYQTDLDNPELSPAYSP